MQLRLRELREARALSQRQLAEASGMAESTVVSLESGARSPRPSTIKKLADALGVGVSRLIAPAEAEARMSPKEFDRRLERLRVIIGDGLGFFTVWRELMVEDADSAQALNRYRGFFLPSRQACFGMMVLHLTKAFDRDKRTASFPNLLGAAAADQEALVPHANGHNLDDLWEQLAAAEPLLDRLEKMRNQQVAHGDITPEVEPVFYGEVKALVDDVQRMYDELRSMHDRSRTVFDGLLRDFERHTQQVVQLMRDDRDTGARRIARAERASRA